MTTVSRTDKQQRLLELLRERAVMRGEFVLSSGQKSNYYIDGRLVTLDGEGALAVGEAILEQIGTRRVAAVGGLTMGADPIAAAVAVVSAREFREGRRASALRAFLVRKDIKKHGTQKLIEGPLKPGEPVVIVEDVVSTGASAIQAADALKELKCPIIAVIALVDREMGGKEVFASAGLNYEPMFTKTELL
ncbi:MAG: orotate phosphoribosyltransferase [Planctomycetes bacterium]|nr:orotate phosphoribosyltransferase [Planctomycetota bacterium]